MGTRSSCVWLHVLHDPVQALCVWVPCRMPAFLFSFMQPCMLVLSLVPSSCHLHYYPCHLHYLTWSLALNPEPFTVPPDVPPPHLIPDPRP